MAGTLYWYQHLGRSDRTDDWANNKLPQPVETTIDWSSYDQVFAAEDGVIYGRESMTKELYWQQHLRRLDGMDKWTVPMPNSRRARVGHGGPWSTYRLLCASDDGGIYGVQGPDQAVRGRLYWHQHLGRSDGTDNFLGGVGGVHIGSAWNYDVVFAAEDAVVYGVDRSSPSNQGELLWYQHLGRINGIGDWTNNGAINRVGRNVLWSNYTQIFGAVISRNYSR